MDSKSTAGSSPTLIAEVPSLEDESSGREPEEPFSWSNTSIAFLGLTIAIATIALSVKPVKRLNAVSNGNAFALFALFAALYVETCSGNR